MSRLRFCISFCLLTGFITAGSVSAAPKTTVETDRSPGTTPNPRSYELNEKGVAAIKSKDFKVAEDLFRRSLAADPGNVTAAFNLAGAYLGLKKNDEAISLLKDYISQYDKDAGLYVRLGDAYFSSRRAKEALPHYERAYAMAPKYEGLAEKLATLYSMHKEYPKAESMYLVALETQPKDWQLLNNLSNIFIVNKKFDKAIGTAKKALQIKAAKEVYITLGTAYEATRDYKNSLIAFQKALDLGDTRPEIQKKVDALKKVAS